MRRLLGRRRLVVRERVVGCLLLVLGAWWQRDLRMRWGLGHALLGMLRGGRGLVGRGFVLRGLELGLAGREPGSCSAVRVVERWLVGWEVGLRGLRWLRC